MYSLSANFKSQFDKGLGPDIWLYKVIMPSGLPLKPGKGEQMALGCTKYIIQHSRKYIKLQITTIFLERLFNNILKKFCSEHLRQMEYYQDYTLVGRCLMRSGQGWQDLPRF